jgi:hypothetical protein
VGMKKLQDIYKKNKDPKYNPALRECCKIIMNALSRKLIQRLFENVKCLIANEKELNSFKKKRQGTQKYIKIDSTKIAIGKKNDIKPNMPTILGILIYFYSRTYMYDTILSQIEQNKLYGTDTDSAFLSYNAYLSLKSSCVNIFGQFKKEILELVDFNNGEKGPYGIFVAFTKSIGAVKNKLSKLDLKELI